MADELIHGLIERHVQAEQFNVAEEAKLHERARCIKIAQDYALRCMRNAMGEAEDMKQRKCAALDIAALIKTGG